MQSLFIFLLYVVQLRNLLSFFIDPVGRVVYPVIYKSPPNTIHRSNNKNEEEDELIDPSIIKVPVSFVLEKQLIITLLTGIGRRHENETNSIF